MLHWLSSNCGTIIVSAILFAVVVAIIKHMVQERKSSNGTSCGCSGCSGCSCCGSGGKCS